MAKYWVILTATVLLALCNLSASEKFQGFSTRLNSGFRVSNLPDFVGFSYSRADTRGAPSNRFISFLNENLNVNANFLPSYSSFEATRPGVYSFNYAFLSDKLDAAIVALRKNGKTVVSALSEEGSYNPVFQSALVLLQPGDVVQLEVLQGKVHETSHSEFAYTTFSGWLIGPTISGGPIGPRPPAPPISPISPPAPPQRENTQCCCRICLPQNMDPPIMPSGKPPYAPPPYAPPPSTEYGVPPSTGYEVPPSISFDHPTATARPPYIITTTSLPAYHPVPASTGEVLTPPDRNSVGRDDDGIFGSSELSCCDSLLVSTSSPASRALEVQDEKFGIYRLQYVDRTLSGKGRATFKHCDRDLFLFYIRTGALSGWVIGPRPGVGIGGLFIPSDEICVEHTNDDLDVWQYYDKDVFLPDPSVSVSCFAEGYLDGRNTEDGTIMSEDNRHYHRHEHFHYGEPKSISFNSGRESPPPRIPSYKVKANPEYVEATFVFPSQQENNATILALPLVKSKWKKPAYQDNNHELGNNEDVGTIVEAKKQTDVLNKDGFVIHMQKDKEQIGPK